MLVSNNNYNYYIDIAIKYIDNGTKESLSYNILNKNIKNENNKHIIDLSNKLKEKLKDKLNKEFIDKLFGTGNSVLIESMLICNGFWDIVIKNQLADYVILKTKDMGLTEKNKEVYIKTLLHNYLNKYELFDFKHIKSLFPLLNITDTKILDKLFESDWGREILFTVSSFRELDVLFSKIKKQPYNKLLLSVFHMDFIKKIGEYTFFSKIKEANITSIMLSVMINNTTEQKSVINNLNNLKTDNVYYFLIRSFFSKNIVNVIDVQRFDSLFKVQYINNNKYFYRNDTGDVFIWTGEQDIFVTNKRGFYPIGYDKIFKDYIFLDADGYIKPLNSNIDYFRESNSAIKSFVDINKQYVLVRKLSDTNYVIT
jgi:hypothetical protein